VPWIVLLLAIPLATAETISADRQTGVRHLLRSLPLSPAAYLAGKLMGVWFGILSGLTAAALLFGLSGWLAYGPYDLGAYVGLWAIGVAPMALYLSGMCTLLAAGQATRGRAVLVGGAFGFACILSMLTQSWTLRDAVSPVRTAVVSYLYRSYFVRIAPTVRNWYPQSYQPAIVPLTIASGAVQVALTWLVIWLWIGRREDTE